MWLRLLNIIFKLNAWLMENIPNSTKSLEDHYTFQYLNLKNWAIRNRIEPTETAIDLSNKKAFTNAAEYGTPQSI